LGLLVLLPVSQSRHTDAATTSQYLSSPNRRLTMAQFREVRAVKDVVGTSALIILVDDWLANEWAVYYLRDMPTRLAAYRMYMAQPHVVPGMRQAATIDPGTIRYVLTDASSSPLESSAQGWQKRWASQAYVLWQTPSAE